jgi:monovalent cation:H+ antiporter-2, CPA2 family
VPHDAPLISLMAIGLGIAFVFGAIAVRLKQPPLVGYLIAGVVVGPFTPGYVAPAETASQLAEIGVILLMFGVGLHFSPRDLLSVRAVAVPVTLLQIAIMMVVGVAIGWPMGWSIETGIVFGLALSIASTVVSLRMLQDRKLEQSERGKLALGWLVVEDLAMVLALVLLPTWAHIRSEVVDGETVTILQLQDAGLAVLLTLLKVAAFALIMLIAAKRVVPWLLHRVVHMGSRELFRLAVLAIALGVAWAAATFFDISFALGALFAGLIMAESELSQQAASETLPLRDAFAVLFFVSVGMLFDPTILWRDPWPLLATVAAIVVLRTTLGFVLLRLFGQTRETALTVTSSRSQIGEFSFILASLAVALGLIPESAHDLILGGAIISILLNPAVFAVTDRLLRRRAAVEPAAQPAPPPPKHRAVLVGYGRVGSLIGKALDNAMAEYSVIEDRQGLIEQLQARGITAVHGNAISREVMQEANVANADLLFVTVPDGFEAGRIVELARELNPKVKVYARAHSDAEVEHLRGFGADLIVSGEQEIADAMIQAASHIIPRRSIARA